MRLRFARGVASFVLAASGFALAQVPEDKAAAEALFDDARKLVKEGKFELACPKFAESQRLDAGIGTQLHLADCYERQGKTASAWGAFREVAGAAKAAGQADRAKIAEGRAISLEAKLTRLTIVLAPGADVAGLIVKRDGVAVSRALFGTAVPVDPGAREIVAEAPGRVRWSAKTEVQGAGATVTVPVLAPADTAAPSASSASSTSAPPPPPPASSPPPPPDPPPKSDARSLSPLGLGVMGAGALAVGVGAYFGLRSFSTYGERKDNCSPDNVCNPRGVQLTEDARSQARLSTVFFAVGAVGVAAGAYLTFGPSKSTAVAPAVGPGTAGLVLGGSL